MKISYIIKELNITQLPDARKLEGVLGELVKKGAIVLVKTDGMSLYKKH